MVLECVTLTDAETGARARVLAGFGFNCFEFTVPGPNGPLDVLWAEPGFESGAARPSGSGTPLLFPFPGRVRGTTLRWQGRDFPLTEGDGRGNAIHGFVLNRPWRVLRTDSAKVAGEFHASRDAPELLDSWPADFRIQATYHLSGTTLSCLLRMDNPGDFPLPCGLGLHPYFRLPLGGPQADDCIIKLPVSRRWNLDGMLTTGEQSEVENASILQSGVPFRDVQMDDVFTGLVFSGDQSKAEIEDPSSKIRLVLSFDDAFRECVVYTPPHREAICMEPYTCAPGPFELHDRGIESGLRILAPGESFEARVTVAAM